MRNGRERDSRSCKAIRPGTVPLVVALMLSLLSQSDGDASGTRGVANGLSWHTIDGGGETFSTGGSFELSGTVGQPDAGVMTGETYMLTGGFWFPLVPDDCNSDGVVNLFDYGDFEACLTGPAAGVMEECRCFDVNRSDTVDLLDFAVTQSTFTGS